jgi:Na+-translocating ferredoxin:NAD+ oxidoreductase RnfD subunit
MKTMETRALRLRAFVRATFWAAVGAFWASFYFLERCSDTVAVIALFVAILLAWLTEVVLEFLAPTQSWIQTGQAVAIVVTGVVFGGLIAGLQFGWTGLTDLYLEPLVRCFDGPADV